MKRKNKTKAEIAEDMKKIEEIKKQKELANATIVPIFTKHELTIYQAGQVLDVLKQVTMGKMNQMWADKPYKELGMAEELTSDEDVKDKNIYSEIITLFEDKPVAEIMKLLDVFTRVIEMYGHRQVMQVKLAELPFDDILSIK